jgi:23S rRNA (uracil1939-C5)-methyltransferase
VAGGHGLARRPDRPVVFVPRTAPGERVEVEYVEERRQWARARTLKVVEASPERREPVCPHFDVCGGCQLQHLRYEAQLSAKSGIIADALRRLGGQQVDRPDVVPALAEFEYRNRVTFRLKRTRAGVVAGFHAFGDPRKINDIDRCPLAEPSVNRVWEGLRASWGPEAERLPPARELRLTLRASTDGAVGLAIEGAEGRGDPEHLMEQVENLAAIWSLGPDGMIDWHEGPAELPDRWDGHELLLAGKAFVQVNRGVAAQLDAYVIEQCGDVAGARVIDAYCGFGLRTIELTINGARASGIDSDAYAIAAAQGLAVESAAEVRFVPDDVEEGLPRLLPADLVILNPPRRGISVAVVEALLAEPPPAIVYVSCDPATLARDVADLSSIFELVACRGFDMFPQTAHVETVATLTRR